jgi:hypothetical protein
MGGEKRIGAALLLDTVYRIHSFRIEIQINNFFVQLLIISQPEISYKNCIFHIEIVLDVLFAKSGFRHCFQPQELLARH